jgi:hypothetical protein
MHPRARTTAPEIRTAKTSPLLIGRKAQRDEATRAEGQGGFATFFGFTAPGLSMPRRGPLGP